MIRTRLVVPSHSTSLVARPRLLECLGDIRTRAATLVQAPPGFGKTCLLSQYKDALDGEGMRTAWVSIDPIDATAETLLDYLAAMTASATPTIAAISNALLDAASPWFLFVDDAGLLPKPALEILLALIERAPPHVHFILSSRGQLDAPLGRLRGQGKLLEIDARQLAFTPREASELLADLDKGRQADVIWRMGGWATGLCLAAQRVGPSSQPMTGRSPQLQEFLLEELLDRQPERFKSFLFETSILASLTAPLCDAVRQGDDSAAILPELARSGVFVTPVDEDRTEWRYSPFFTEFLRSASPLSGAQEIPLHQRAARWHVANGAIPEALEHLFSAGAMDDLAALLETHCEALTYNGKILVVDKFSEQLSADVLATLPKVLLTLAWLRIRQLRFEDTKRLLALAGQRIDELAEAGAAESDVNMLRLMLAHRETALATARDDMTDVDERSRRLLDDLGDQRPYLTCSLYSQMVYARCDQYRIADFDQLEPHARVAMGRSGFRFASIGLQASLGGGLFAAGRTQEAALTFEQAFEAALQHNDMEGMAALPALPLAKLLYEWNEQERAENLIREYLPVARSFGYADQLIAGYITSGRLSQAHHDNETALRTLDEGTRVAIECGLDRMRLSMAAEKLRFLIRTGHPNEALALGRSEGVSLDEAGPDPRSNATTRKEMRAFMWARLAMSSDRPGDAIALAKQWRSFCSSRGAIRTLMRWNVLLARLYCVTGDPQAARRVLHDAVVIGAPGRFIRSFVDEGSIVERLLLDSYGSAAPIAAGGDQGEDGFARALLKAFGATADSLDEDAADDLDEGLYGRINTKELEILTLVGRGLRNREIGARLGLTEGTVKWYMQQIYDKLGVRRRPQAVERARQFGMLS